MTASGQPHPTIENRLLAALPKKESKRLLSLMEEVPLPFAEIIYEPGDTIQHVYFPSNGFISLLSTVEDRSTLEVGLVGREGMVGLPVFLGVSVSLNRAIVQGEGTAMRMKATTLRKELIPGGALNVLLQRYTHALLTQISQSAACNRFHMVNARLARWLLMTHDRVDSNDFRLTQEFLSKMLGVRREAVVNAASFFQKKKLINYSRGHMTILNRARLEQAACKCYGVLKAEYDGLPA